MIQQNTTNATIALLDGRTGKETITIDVPGSEVWRWPSRPTARLWPPRPDGRRARSIFYDVASGKETGTIDAVAPLAGPRVHA